jgi:hypothetical protein
MQDEEEVIMKSFIYLILLAVTAMSASALAAKPTPEQETGLPATGRTVGGPGVYTGAMGTNQIYQLVPLDGWINTPCITVSNKGTATATLQAEYPGGEPFTSTIPSGGTSTACFEDDVQPPTKFSLECTDGAGQCLVYWRLDSLQ